LPYFQINDVKKALRLSVKGTSYNPELKRCFDAAFVLVDGLLNAQGLKVPTAVLQNIADSARYFATWEFQRKRKRVKDDMFWQEKGKLLFAFVEQFAVAGFPFYHLKVKEGCESED
jgi:hypothetical protein